MTGRPWLAGLLIIAIGGGFLMLYSSGPGDVFFWFGSVMLLAGLVALVVKERAYRRADKAGVVRPPS